MKKLKDRWQSEDGTALYRKILDALNNRKSLENLKIPTHNERLDLRGITLLPKVNVKQVNLAHVDFSYATLYESSWEQCVFTDLLFLNTKFDYSKFWACEFNNIVFENSYLNEVLLNGRLQNKNGYFKNVKFISSNLKGTYYTNTLFEHCEFVNCKLHQVDFNGSRFAQCRFVGLLDEVFFHGNEPVNRKLYPDVISFPNKMEQVDFSEAILESVDFLDGINLNNCLFPTSDDYICVTGNRNSVFEEVRKVVVADWDGTHKDIALTLIDRSYLSPRHRNNNGAFIDKLFMIKVDKTFGEKLFNLINEKNAQINQAAK